MGGSENASNGIPQEQVRVDAGGGARRTSPRVGRFAALGREGARHPIRDGTHPSQVDFPEDGNVPAGGIGHRGRSRYGRGAPMTGLCRQAISRDQTRSRMSPRIDQETRGFRARTPQLGVANWELVRADELQLLSRSSTLPNWGKTRPFCAPYRAIKPAVDS